MNFLKALFGGKEENSEEKRLAEEQKNFDILKYDGVKAVKTGQWQQAISCLNHALNIREDLECRDYLSQALLQNNELTASYEQLQLLQEAEPDNEDILLRMAQVAFLMEDYGAMVSACEKGLLLSNDWESKPSFSFEGLNDIKPEMIEEATKNAREVAQKFADDSDSKLGKIRDASQGYFTIEDRDANTPYIKKVRVVTNVNYGLSR